MRLDILLVDAKKAHRFPENRYSVLREKKVLRCLDTAMCWKDSPSAICPRKLLRDLTIASPLPSRLVTLKVTSEAKELFKLPVV